MRDKNNQPANDLKISLYAFTAASIFAVVTISYRESSGLPDVVCTDPCVIETDK